MLRFLQHRLSYCMAGFVGWLFTMLVVANSASAGLLTVGKYNRDTLDAQFSLCGGFTCDDCMSNRWPGLPNPFIDQDTPDCNGIVFPFASTNKLFRWGDGNWGWFALIGDADELQATINYCHQNFNEINCSYPEDWGPEPVPGAYYPTMQLVLNDLDEGIDRDHTGWPSYYDPAPFDPIRPYVDQVGLENQYDWRLGWRIIFEGAIRYVADIGLGEGPPPVADGGSAVGDATLSIPHVPSGSQADIDFGLKVAIHALVATETWEVNTGEILQPYGIEPFCGFMDEACAPTFVYEIWNAFDDIVRPYVAVEQSTWGKIKALYQDPGGR